MHSARLLSSSGASCRLTPCWARTQRTICTSRALCRTPTWPPGAACTRWGCPDNDAAESSSAQSSCAALQLPAQNWPPETSKPGLSAQDLCKNGPAQGQTAGTARRRARRLHAFWTRWRRWTSRGTGRSTSRACPTARPRSTTWPWRPACASSTCARASRTGLPPAGAKLQPGLIGNCMLWGAEQLSRQHKACMGFILGGRRACTPTLAWLLCCKLTLACAAETVACGTCLAAQALVAPEPEIACSDRLFTQVYTESEQLCCMPTAACACSGRNGQSSKRGSPNGSSKYAKGDPRSRTRLHSHATLPVTRTATPPGGHRSASWPTAEDALVPQKASLTPLPRVLPASNRAKDTQQCAQH